MQKHIIMASPHSPATMENLPFDVLSNIFIRLLAKQVAQMRCVCKSWNALFSESSFVKSHLHHSVHNNDESLLFFGKGTLFDDYSFTTHTSRSPDFKLTRFTKIPVYIQFSYTYGNVIGFVNGLVCFYYKSYRDDYVVHIWNPSISTILTLPPCSLPSRNLTELYFRFGFDPKNDDYKLVKLTSLSGPPKMVHEVEVYSMRKGLWELVSLSIPPHIAWISDKDKVCVNDRDGHLHWLAYSDEEMMEQMIVALDLGEETFSLIPLPDYILDTTRRYNVVGVLTGKLCVMSSVRYGDQCEVWVMDEYGVSESWVKHHVISQFGGYIIPYGFTLHNEFVFEVDGRFGLYNPIAAKTKTFKVMYGLGKYKIVEYIDSLVWVEPTEHELLKGHLSVSTLKRHQLLLGLRMVAHPRSEPFFMLARLMWLCFEFFFLAWCVSMLDFVLRAFIIPFLSYN